MKLDLSNLRGDIYGGITAGVVALPLALALGGASSLGPIAGRYGEKCHDPGCGHEIGLDNGKKMTAVQIQCEYLEMAKAYLSGRDVHPVLADVVDKWEQVMVALQRDPMELSDRIDWVIKRRVIEDFMERKGLDWESPQVRMLDLQYHDSRPDKGLYHMLARQGRLERIVSDEEIRKAVHRPPDDTRAYFRGECLRRYPGQVFGVNWDSISFGLEDQPIKRVMMHEPLKGTRELVEDLLDQSDTAAALVRNLGS